VVQCAMLIAMNRKAVLRVAVAIGLAALALPGIVLADDSAAAIAAGGLVPRRETRIVMAKEVLRISLKKIVVDYDFRNDTDEDVTTEVAFPIPPYKNEFPEGDIQAQSFKDFHLWVDGKPILYKSEVKATLNGRDVTGILEANHIDIRTFGHFDDTTEDAHHVAQILVPDFTRLPKDAQIRLFKEGLFQDQGEFVFSLYTVHLQYHWTQTFPAHSTVRIRHEYSPVVGYHQMDIDSVKLGLQPASAQKAAALDPDSRSALDDLMSYCPDAPFLRGVERQVEASGKNAADFTGGQYWVDFILTSANTWQRPIEDFTLIIERPQPEQGLKTLVSFCSPANSKVEKLDADHFQVHLTKLVPTSELHIGFFEIHPPTPDHPSAKSSPPASHRRTSVMIVILIVGGLLIGFLAVVRHLRKKSRAIAKQV